MGITTELQVGSTD